MSVQGQQPISFVLGSAPPGDKGLDVYMKRALQQISASITSLLTLTPQVATKAPVPPVVGMQRLAVAPWRPVAGQTADRWVTYYGGAWVYSNSM